MRTLVLDSWAIMAWLKGQQPATQHVRSLLDAVDRREHRLIMNVVNLGEVFYLSVKAKNLAYGQRVLTNIRSRLTIMSADDDLVMRAAEFKARYPISYADGFAAATAISRKAPLVTGDPELKTLSEQEPALQLEWVGE